MVTSVDDVVEELTPISARARSPASAVARGAKTTAKSAKVDATLPEVRISSEESKVLRAVSEEGVTMDVVARACGLGAACVGALLVGLRLKGRVRLLPGNRVALAQSGRS
jgi:predicted Rossmann fold nucleotide-binding protein DprA/Smf involved in DNA uptake